MENTDGAVGGKTKAVVSINKDTQSAKNYTAATLGVLLASVKDMPSRMVSYDQKLRCHQKLTLQLTRPQLQQYL